MPAAFVRGGLWLSVAHCISSVVLRQTVIFQPVRSDSSSRQSGTEHLGLYGQAAVPVSALLSNLNPPSAPAFISRASGFLRVLTRRRLFVVGR